MVVRVWNRSGGVRANLSLFVHGGDGLDRACLGKSQSNAPWSERGWFEEWRPCELQRRFVIDQRHGIRKQVGWWVGKARLRLGSLPMIPI